MTDERGADDLFATPRVEVEARADGTRVLRSGVALEPYANSLTELFVAGARAHPERTLVAEREGDGWRTVSWGEALTVSESLGQAMLERGLGPERPLMILSGNSVEHLLLTLGALSVGVPVMPISAAYSMAASGEARIRAIAELCRPGMVWARDGQAVRAAMGALSDLVPTQAVSSGAEGQQVSFDALASTTVNRGDLGRARASVGPDSLAKILFTSGSTGDPKGVLNTHRMLCANQQSIAQVWPFLTAQPPVLVDWLPWSHTFGGNHNLNQVLAFGGTIHIDPGRPLPGAFDGTVAALREIAPTVYYNVPAAWAMLAPMLERDEELRDSFFSRLRLMFYAAAALPEAVWLRLSRLAELHAPREVPLTASWGCTESSPAATMAHFRSAPCGCIGVPIPGIEVKLAPVADKLEIRLRGPSITQGYFRNPAATEAAFDEEGFYRTGDAVRFSDESDPALGLMFDGRLAEDFKLDSGTWVHVGSVRLRLISELGILRDAVICGHDRPYAAALAWLDADAAARVLGGEVSGPEDPRVISHIAQALGRMNAQVGSAARIERLRLLTEPPSLVAGEITDKGYVNQAKVLQLRAAEVLQLFAGDPAGGGVILATRELTALAR